MHSFKTLPALMLAGIFVAAATIPATAQTPITDTFQVRITILGTCVMLTPTDIDFGTQTPTAAGSSYDANGTINVRCTQDHPFTLGLDGGVVGKNVNARAMKHATLAATIPYTLSNASAGGAVWGDTNTNWVSGTGAGLNTNVAFNVYGRATVSGSEPVGVYTDTVTATLTF